MISKIIISCILLSLCVVYSLGANVKRHADAVIDNAGEDVVVKGNVNKEDLSMRDIKDGAKKLLGIGQSTPSPYKEEFGPDATGILPADDGSVLPHGDNVVGGPHPTRPSKIKQVLKSAAQGALAGAAAAAVGSAIQNRNN